MPSQEVTELQHAYRFLEKPHAAEVHQTSMMIADLMVRGEYRTLRNL